MTAKTCFRCLIEQPLDEFYKHPKMTDGRLNKCRTCTKADADAWRKANRDQFNRTRRARALRQKYNIDINVYDAMLARQGGVCAGCQRPPNHRWLCVDHDHTTNQVRGLLCMNCNLVVGDSTDASTILRRLADYLDGCF